MDKNKLILIISILIAILLIIFFATRFQGGDEPQPVETAPFEVDENGLVTKLNVKRQYKDGIHTIVGEIEVPTPCHSVSATALKGEGNTVFIDVASVKDGDEVCVEVISSETFIVSFEADQDVMVTGTVNGNPVDFNIFEVGENELLEDKTLYFKG